MQEVEAGDALQFTGAVKHLCPIRLVALESALYRCGQIETTRNSSKRMSWVEGVLTLILCWFYIGGGTLFAQIDRGTIEGQVTDSQGAIVPAAKVQVTNISTSSSIELATNDQGLYTAANLPSGTYRVVISREGFKTETREPIDLRPSFTVRADFKLQPGGKSLNLSRSQARRLFST
jgi:hypothetical protein